MTTVTGTIRSLRATAKPGTQLRWRYLSAPASVQGALVDSVDDIVTVCDVLGTFSQAMTGGDYELTIDGGATADKWTVGVPADDLSYDILALIDSPLATIPEPPGPAVVPHATSSVYGDVKLVKDGTLPKVPVGFFEVTNVTALKALTADAANTYARLTTPGTSEKSEYDWNNTSAAADDTTNFLVVRPGSLPATGRWLARQAHPITEGGTGSRTAALARAALSMLSQEEIWTLAHNRRPRAGLVFDSAGSNRLTDGATGIPLGLGDFSIAFLYQKRVWNSTGDVWLYTHGTGNSLFRCGMRAGAAGMYVIFKDSGGTETQYNLTPDVALVDGETYLFVITVDRDGLATLYVNSVSDRDASGAAVTISVAASSAVDIGASNTNPAAGCYGIDGTVFSLRVYNRLLTQADITYLNRNGIAAYSDQHGLLGAKYTSDFSAGVDSFADVSATIAGNVDGIGGEDNVLQVTAAASRGKATRVITSRLIGKRLKVIYKVYIPSTNATGVCVLAGQGTSSSNITAIGFTLRTPAANTWVTYTEEVVITAALTGLQISLFTAGGASQVVTDGDIFYVKDVVAEYPGVVSDWDFADADPQISTTLVDRAGLYNLTISNTVYQSQPKPQLNAGRLVAGGVIRPLVTLTYAASVAIDWASTIGDFRALALTGNITLTDSNIQAGRYLSIFISADGSTRTFTAFPAWVFIGAAAPASIAANKAGILELWSTGSTAGSVRARWTVQP